MDSLRQDPVIQIHIKPAEEMMGGDWEGHTVDTFKGEEVVAAASLSWLYISFGQSLAV